MSTSCSHGYIVEKTPRVSETEPLTLLKKGGGSPSGAHLGGVEGRNSLSEIGEVPSERLSPRQGISSRRAYEGTRGVSQVEYEGNELVRNLQGESDSPIACPVIDRRKDGYDYG